MNASRGWLGVCLLLAAAALSAAADWPQFLGPQRNGQSKETGLSSSWPKDGPPLVWSRNVGEGFSGPVIAGGRLILFHRAGDQEIVECLDAATGKAHWKQADPCSYQDAFGKGNGPRATPVVAGKKVLTLGVEGRLTCRDLESGQLHWQRDTNRDYRVPESFFGVGASPLVVDELVLVNVGAKDAGIVAFRLADGKEAWRATSDGASYASAVQTGTGDVAFFTRNGVVLLDPKTGKAAHQQRWRARIEASVNAATPLVIGDLLFFSASYDTGALLLRRRNSGVEEVWKSDEVMSNHYNTCVHHQGHLYGFHGRQEAGPDFRCVELATQKVKWDRPRFGCGAMILADGHLILLTERGDLLLVEATPEAYREKARARVFTNGPCRAQIALADGLLYGRDQGKLACWKVIR